MYEVGVTFILKKRKFFAEAIDFLGSFIRPGRFKLTERVTNAVVELVNNLLQTEQRSLLGLCNVFRQFVQNFARLAAPLDNKLRMH